MIDRLVYLTGMPRSGTTFVARHLAFDPRVAYVHEPFNPDCGVVGWDERFRRPDVETVGPMVAELLAKRARFKTARYDSDTGGRRILKTLIGSRGRFAERRNRYMPGQRAMLVKDPTAPFLAEAMASLGHDVVFLVRHPASVVASYKRLGWTVAGDLSRARDWTGPSSERLGIAGQPEHCQVAQLWQLSLHAALSARQRHPDRVSIVTYEALAAEPLVEVPALAEHLELPFGRASAMFLDYASSGRTGVRGHARGPTQKLRRDSNALAQQGWGSLNGRERGDIEQLCSAGLQLFYGAGTGV